MVIVKAELNGDNSTGTGGNGLGLPVSEN